MLLEIWSSKFPSEQWFSNFSLHHMTSRSSLGDLVKKDSCALPTRDGALEFVFIKFPGGADTHSQDFSWRTIVSDLEQEVLGYYMNFLNWQFPCFTCSWVNVALVMPKQKASKNKSPLVNYQNAYKIAICNACSSTSVTKIYNAHVNVYQLDVNYMYLQFIFYLRGPITYLTSYFC